MGFADNQASLQTATDAGDLALATTFDGYVPPPPAPSPVALPPVALVGGTLATSATATAPAAAAAAPKASWWSGIGSALHDGATWLGDHVEVRAQLSTSATPVTPFAIAPRQVAPEHRWAPWAIAAGVVLLVLWLIRR